MNITIDRKKILLWSVLLFFGFLYTLIVVMNHYFFRTNALDYGFHIQAIWEMTHIERPASSIYMPPIGSFFQVHPTFILPVITPLYMVLNPIFGSYTLLIIQNIFILTGGYGTYLFIKDRSGDFYIGLLAMIHFFLLWGHFSAIAFEYIDVTVASSVVPLFLYFFYKKKFIAATLCFIFIIISRENMPLWFIFIGITLFMLNYKRDLDLTKAGILYSLFSLFYIVFIFKVIIPFFEDPLKPYWGFAYGSLGNNMSEVIGNTFSHPLKTLNIFFSNTTGDSLYNGIKGEFFLVFFLSGGILLLLRPVLFIWFIPVIAQKMLNDSYVRWGINIFYSIEVVSILSVSAFYTMIKFKNIKLKYISYISICLVTLATTLIKIEHRTSKWYDKPKEAFFHKNFYTAPFNPQKIREAISEIVPKDAAVSASEKIVPHYAERKKIYIFPNIYDAEYVIILFNSSTYPMNQDEFNKIVNDYLEDPNWKQLFNENSLLILKNDYKKNSPI